MNPLYYVTFTTATLCASFILFRGFNTSDPVNTISLLCGFLIIFSGVYLLNHSRSDPNGTRLEISSPDGVPTDGIAGFQTRRSMQLRRSADHRPSLVPNGPRSSRVEEACRNDASLIGGYDEENAVAMTDLAEDLEEEESESEDDGMTRLSISRSTREQERDRRERERILSPRMRWGLSWGVFFLCFFFLLYRNIEGESWHIWPGLFGFSPLLLSPFYIHLFFLIKSETDWRDLVYLLFPIINGVYNPFPGFPVLSLPQSSASNSCYDLKYSLFFFFFSSCFFPLSIPITLRPWFGSVLFLSSPLACWVFVFIFCFFSLKLVLQPWLWLCHGFLICSM